MGKLKYIIGRVFGMDYKSFFETVNKAHEMSGKNRMYLFFDIIRCGFRYGAGYNDYLLCDFFNLTAEQRKTYVTRSVNNTLVSMLNDREHYHTFDNKDEFYTLFGDLIGREWIHFSMDEKQKFLDFMENRDVVIVKPKDGTGGKGVEKLNKNEFSSMQKMMEYMESIHVGVVEDVIVQNEVMGSLHPNSINTLRIVTILNDKGPHIVYAHVRIGNHGRPVDNLHSGGMFAPIDMDTGVVTFPAYDRDKKTYDVHPLTDVAIKGFQIPLWKESKELCKAAAKRVPQMRYIGWDVAISDKGPVLVEGNNLPGYDIIQMPPHTPDKIGMLPHFRKYVDGI